MHAYFTGGKIAIEVNEPFNERDCNTGMHAKKYAKQCASTFEICTYS